jgi:isoleucyl-tRNA synthetase
MAETMWQNLAGVFGLRATPSVHLCDYPQPDPAARDDGLVERMNVLREIASLGRGARMEARLKVRQPLAGVTVALNDQLHQEWLAANDAILRDELNVRTVDFTGNAADFVSYHVQPNFKLLGPKVGRLMPAVKKALGEVDGGKVLAELAATGKYQLAADGEIVELDHESIAVRLQAKPGWAAAQGSRCVVVLATELTPELVREGVARDLVRAIQDRRKELGLQFTDRIEVGLRDGGADLASAVDAHRAWIMSETLANKIVLESLAGCEEVEREAGEGRFWLSVRCPTNLGQ